MGTSDVRFLLSAFGRAQWPPADRPEVAFAGRSNVGKSSCLNLLVGRSGFAKVSKTPGRTQSINFFELRRDGLDLRFADLPGYGFAKVPAKVRDTWERMVGGYLEGRGTLALVVVLVDIRRDATDLDRQMVEWLAGAGRRGVVVLTKADRVPKNQRLHRQSLICKGLGVPREESLLLSSTERFGAGELWARIDAATGEGAWDGEAGDEATAGGPDAAAGEGGD